MARPPKYAANKEYKQFTLNIETSVLNSFKAQCLMANIDPKDFLEKTIVNFSDPNQKEKLLSIWEEIKTCC